MTALAFSEHGSLFSWWNKKVAIEAAGMKYIHAIEAYITNTLDEKVRDNYHCVLIARNYEGFKELNRMVSKSFNRKDNHFYYAPRISYEELTAASDNIIITTACIGGILSKGDEDIKEKFLRFCINNKERCFLEIGHHPDIRQCEYNAELEKISKQYGVRLIVGTDTHALNKDHVEGRHILQLSKNIHFAEEEGWDLTFKTYDELVSAFDKQKALSAETYLQAIENTNVLADMVEPFEIDCGFKYPKIYNDPVETFYNKIEKAVESHEYLNDRYLPEEVEDVVNSEFDVYKTTGAIDFMLLQTYMREWEHKHDIWCGPGRGSVSGSLIAYALGITNMDSLKFHLNFFRFMNPSRVSLADIDTDYAAADRTRVKQFLLRDHMELEQIHTSEIITFNTIALKGAIRDVGRALQMPLSEVSDICGSIGEGGLPESLPKKYPELFKYVDIVSGTIVSIGTHPSGVLITDKDIEELIGVCSTSTSDYPISMLNMKELDAQMWVKLDILGLDNVGLINETCKLAGIPIATPDNTDLDDMAVWDSIRDDTTLIFQWESDSAQAYLRKFMSSKTIEKARKLNPEFSMIKWMSFGNGLIRPACASYRNDVAEGNSYDNGFDELNKFLAQEMGHVCMQETIMQFLVKFCGYSAAESDLVRRSIAKRKGTEKLLPEIERRFIEYSSQHYDISTEKCEEIIKPFIEVILDASSYAFSWNHSDSYSCIGYICGYLRYYYPFEFITAALNIFRDNEEKTKAITEYAQKHNIKIVSPKFGISLDEYFYDKEQKVIAKGIESIKYLNGGVARELYELAHKHTFTSFTDVLYHINHESKLNSKQLDILIRLDFFSEYGNQPTLLKINDMYEFFKGGNMKQIHKDKVPSEFYDIIVKHGNNKSKSGSEGVTYKLTDVRAIIEECEAQIVSCKLPDWSYKEIVKQQIELLGYIDLTTNKKEDIRLLLITEKPITLQSKKDGITWAYRINTRSIGTGNSARLTVKAKVFEHNPIKMGSVIYASSLTKNDAGYWYLNEYKLVD